MRILVQCTACQRKFDASKLEPGSRFRCHCGEVVEAQGGRGREATYLCCSSCGAAREDSSEICSACSAAFSAQDHDLNTVCPKCQTQVSDQSQFCHHCAATLNAETCETTPTSSICPHCTDHAMLARSVGKNQTPVLECNNCSGIWLSNEVFEGLVSQAQKARESQDNNGPIRRQELSDQSGWKYRKCPTCHEMMARRNYGRRSGVIVDICRAHGIWFDPDELPQILRWIKQGGLSESNRLQAEEEKREEERAESRRREANARDDMYDRHQYGRNGLEEVFLGAALLSLFDF